jgi:DNA-binding response OmpR family regulator
MHSTMSPYAKRQQVLRDIPVIIISAEHDSKSVVTGIKQGAEDYLTKPVKADLLVKKVREYLG